jgi:hypothetical protein
MQLRQFSVLLCSPISNHPQFIHQTSLLWLQQRHLVGTLKETGREMTAEFCLSVSLSQLKGSLICRKILRYGAEGFTSTPKEVVLRIFIALKTSSLWAGSEPANIGSNVNNDNHYTTENDKFNVTAGVCGR